VSELHVLETEADVTADILAAVEECVDWFDEERSMPVEAFIDRLCDAYGAGWDIESYDNAAVRKIMRKARQIRRERNV
jgi:hypothetical protein